MSLFDSEIPDDLSTDEKLNRIRKQLLKDPNNPEMNKAYARILLDESPNFKRAEMAMKSLEITLSQQPENWDAKMLVIRGLRWMERYDEALVIAEEISKKMKNSALLYNEIGRTYEAKNELDLAFIKLEEGIIKFPNDGKLMRSMIDVLQKLSEIEKDPSKLEDALRICNRGLNDNPNEKRFASKKIILTFNLKKYNESIECIEEFQKKYPRDFLEPMFTFKSGVTSVALISSQNYNFEARRILFNSISENPVDYKIAKQKTLKDNPKIVELFEKSNNLIDDSLKIFTNYDMQFWLVLKLQNLKFLEKWEEALVTIDEIIMDDRNILNYSRKIDILIHLNQFKKALKLSEDILNDNPPLFEEGMIRKMRVFCFDKLGKRDNISEEEKILKKLKSAYMKKYPEKIKKEKQAPATNDTLDRIEEKIDRLGTNMSSSDRYYFNNADKPFKNQTELIRRFEKMKNIVSYNDDWIKINHLRDLDDNIEFENLEIIKIRLMQKVFSYQDKGKQFFSQFRGLVRGIKSFNDEHKNCQIEYRVFFTEIAEVTSPDKFHRRYLFDNNIVYEMPGSGQISESPKHDSMIKCDLETAGIIRKDFDQIWQEAESTTKDEIFIEKFVRYLFKKEKGCYRTIEEEYPDIVSKIEKELEDERKSKAEKKRKAEKKPDYINDESTILHNVEQIIFKKPEIIDNLKQNPEEIGQALSKIMAETKGEKMDPDIVKKILKEKAEQ